MRKQKTANNKKTRRVLEFLSHILGELETWERGEVVEVPSPAIDGRTDIVVVLFPYAEIEDPDDGDAVEVTWPAGLVIRNDGDYDPIESMKLAKQLARLVRKLEPCSPGSILAYSDDTDMVGDTDPLGYWIDFVSHPKAAAMLRKLDSEPKPKRRAVKAKRGNSR